MHIQTSTKHVWFGMVLTQKIRDYAFEAFKGVEHLLFNKNLEQVKPTT